MLRRLRIENLVLIREAELELSGGLNAISGETGAGKTILAQAVGLLLGAKGDRKAIGPSAAEAYVEAEFELPDGFLEEEGLEALAELRPEDEPGLVLARRIFADGRTRAYAWGRAAAREDVAAAGELLVGMSGQFEQRRLARPAYQLDVLDSFAGDDQLRRRAALRKAWRELGAARRRYDDVARDAAAAEARLGELQAIVEDTSGLDVTTEAGLLAERERLRHLTELAEGASGAVEFLAPDDGGEGAAGLTAQAERAIAPLERIAPELAQAATELRDSGVRLRETAAELRSFLSTLEAEPGRLEHVEGELERIAAAKRRFGCASYDELLERAAQARRELDAREAGLDPAAEVEAELGAAQAAVDELVAALRKARRAAAKPFAKAVAAELQGVGLGEGEFHVELGERDPSPAGADTATFLIRPNAGLPFAPVAETASGGELSRIALAIAAAAGGKMTLVFDEIDAGIGGQTAHAVAQTLRRLGERSQVVTITHLPQIASVADRHFSVEKVARRPHAHPNRGAGRNRPKGRARAYARRPRVSLDRQMSFVEHTGPARLDRRTKQLVRRLSPDAIAIIDHADLDRVSAEELLEAGVRVVINCSESQTGRFPNPGPLLLVRGGVRLIDAPGADLFDKVSDGELLTVRGSGLFRNGTRIVAGKELRADELAEALREQRGRVTEALETFAENTMRYLREEGRLLSEGIGFPAFETRFRDRHALVVVRGPGHKRDLRIVKPYVRDFRPVLVAVDGGADALIEAGYKPHVIVGDMDSVSDKALKSGAELVVHAYENGAAPGSDRLRAMGLDYHVVPAPATSEDVALLLAYEKGAELIVAVGTHFNLIEFLERNRSGMSSTFLTRVKVGEILVDAKGVSRLFSRKVGIWPLLVVPVIGLFALVVAVAVSPQLRSGFELLALELRDLVG